MSLSKPALIPLPPSARPHVVDLKPNPASGCGCSEWSFQKIGIFIGLPVAVCTALGVYYWYSYKKKPPGSSNSGKKDQTSVLGSKSKASGPETEKPKYSIIKDTGNELFRTADYAGALEAYAQAIAEQPPQEELAKLHQNRAAVFEKMGDWVQLIRETTAAILIDPNYVKARHRRAKAYQKTGFLDEALEDVTAACMLEGFQRQSTIMMADEILKEIGSRDAAKLMETKKPSAPSDHGIVSFLRSFYSDPVTVWWKDPESSHLATFKGQVNDGQPGGDSDSEQIKGFVAAVQALKDKKYDDILDFCTEELKNPDSKHIFETYLLRGTFRFLWGFGEEVVSDLSQITNSEKAEPMLKSSAFVKLALRYALVSDEAKCAECFQKAEEVYPENVDIYHHSGQCLLTLGDFDRAAAMIDKAYQICPDFAIAAASKWYTEYRIAARASDQTGIDFAMKQFTKCMKKFPEVPDISNLFGQIQMELGQFQRATEQFDNVIRLDPGNASVFVHKAMAQYQLNQNMEQALQLLRDATIVDDKCEYLYETMGTLQLQAGDLQGAVESITKALNLAKTQQELVMLSSLKRAAEVQSKMKGAFDAPGIGNIPNAMP